MNILQDYWPDWLRTWIYNRRLKKSRAIYTGKKIPETLYDAVEELISQQTPETIKQIKECDDHFWHFTSGMSLRNNWGLWQNSVLAQWFKNTLGLGHPDDMSSIIYDATIAKIRGKPFDLSEQVEKYKTHWKVYGIDPLTQERVGPSPKSYKIAKDGTKFDIVY